MTKTEMTTAILNAKKTGSCTPDRLTIAMGAAQCEIVPPSDNRKDNNN
jgi:hypothetical protein